MDKNLPKRKHLRWRGFDYSRSGAYFVTVCTHERKNTLSHIVGAIHESPAPVLTEYGKIVDAFINNVQNRFGASVDQYVIMPNHIHLIIIVTDDSETNIENSPLRGRSLLSKIMGYIKANTAKEIHKKYGASAVWQRGFYDHVIRSQDDYREIEKYIRENPLCWQMGRTEDW